MVLNEFVKFLNLIFFTNKAFKSQIADTLSNIWFPTGINRTKFNLDIIHQWKANEFRSFFFLLAIPILSNLFPTAIVTNLFYLIYCKLIFYK